MFTATIAGNLGKDPETRFTASGQKVTSFSVAVNQRKGKEDVTIWVRVTVWGDRFDKLISYLKKGSGVIITGKMNPPTTYADKEGRVQVSLELVAEMIDFNPFGKTDKPAEGAPGANNYSTSYSQQPQQQTSPYMQEEPAYSQSQPFNAYGSGMSSFGSNQSAGPSKNTTDDDGLPF